MSKVKGDNLTNTVLLLENIERYKVACGLSIGINISDLE